MKEISNIISSVVDESEKEDVEKDIVSKVSEEETMLNRYVVDEIYKVVFNVIKNLMPEFVEMTDENKKNIAMDKYVINKIYSSKENLSYNLLPLLSYTYNFEEMLNSDMDKVFAATLKNIIKFIKDNSNKVVLSDEVKSKIESTILSACDEAIKDYKDYMTEAKEDEEDFDPEWTEEKIEIVKTIKEDPSRIVNGIIDGSLSYVVTSLITSNIFDYNDELKELAKVEINKGTENQEYKTDDLISHIKNSDSLKTLFNEVPEEEFASFARVYPGSQKH